MLRHCQSFYTELGKRRSPIAPVWKSETKIPEIIPPHRYRWIPVVPRWIVALGNVTCNLLMISSAICFACSLLPPLIHSILFTNFIIDHFWTGQVNPCISSDVDLLNCKGHTLMILGAKSIASKNTRSQIRNAVSQLYQYSYEVDLKSYKKQRFYSWKSVPMNIGLIYVDSAISNDGIKKTNQSLECAAIAPNTHKN